jgi:hypothetical protein
MRADEPFAPLLKNQILDFDLGHPKDHLFSRNLTYQRYIYCIYFSILFLIYMNKLSLHE